MAQCDFCHDECPVQGRFVTLCPQCRDQVASLDPSDASYHWFVNAIRAAIKRR